MPLPYPGNEFQAVRAAVPKDAIRHVMVTNLESENFAANFGPTSPGVYLNTTLRAQGRLLTHDFATNHATLGNDTVQFLGQAPTPSINNDCLEWCPRAESPSAWRVRPTGSTTNQARALRRIETMPAFMFVTLNLCDDAHDATCAGVNIEGGKAGGLVAEDL